nr:MAG TPA: Protein of unknown function (DUF3139) [Crassvirales sp.]
MKKNIISIIMCLVLVCAGITIYFQHKTITEQHGIINKQRSTINDFKAYYNAAEDLIESIDKDIDITFYMCGDIGADYLYSASKIDDSIRVKPSDYLP